MRKREGENSGRFCWKNEKLWGLSWVESFVPFVALGHFPELKPAKRKTFFLVWGTIESFFPPLLTNASDWPDRTKQKCNEHLLNRIIFEWIELKHSEQLQMWHCIIGRVFVFSVFRQLFYVKLYDAFYDFQQQHHRKSTLCRRRRRHRQAIKRRRKICLVSWVQPDHHCCCCFFLFYPNEHKLRRK